VDITISGKVERHARLLASRWLRHPSDYQGPARSHQRHAALRARRSRYIRPTAGQFSSWLLDDPRRVGKPLGAELTGVYSARLGGAWRVLYEIDAKQLAVVLDIRHRSIAYRRR